MSRKHLVSGALVGILAFLLLSVVVAFTPAQQEDLTTDQRIIQTLNFDHTQQALERQINRDQSTQIAQLWLTVDSQQIATLVSTFTATNTLTRTPVIAPPSSPTPEQITPFSPTPTFRPATNTPTPSRTATVSAIPSVTPTALPTMTCATNVGSVPRNVRLEPNTTSEVVAVIQVNGVVCLDIRERVNAENFVWIRTWSDQDAAMPGHQGWISVERINPYAVYIDW